MAVSEDWSPGETGDLELDLIELIMFGCSDGGVSDEDIEACREDPGTYEYAAQLVIGYLRKKGVVLDE
jgi:hypothetical protein